MLKFQTECRGHCFTVPWKFSIGISRGSTETVNPCCHSHSFREKVPPNLIYKGMAAPWFMLLYTTYLMLKINKQNTVIGAYI